MICLTLLSAKVYSQKFEAKALEKTLHKAIEKAYPASVRMWGFDTVEKQQMSGQFSGVVVSADGYILTAAHTTTPGKTYKVMFPDGKEAIARALGKIELADDNTIPDVSMMKIVTKGTWPFAEMGYSSAIKVNEPCLSIAYPETLYQPLPSVRFGHIVNVKNERGFIQSTCIMEPGDSGGPLFDHLGRVIALHSAINVPEEFNYEIPVDLYRKYWKALNAAEKYNALPTLADSVGIDPLTASIIALPQLQNLSKSFINEEKTYSKSCVLLSSKTNGAEQKIYGTLFSSAGFKTTVKGTFIVSKSSMLGEVPTVNIDGKQIPATIIKRDRENDLVLLQVKNIIKGSVSLKPADTAAIRFEQLGKFLVSPRADTTAAISVVGSTFFGLSKQLSMGFMGASIPYKKGPLLVSWIRPGSPAAVADIQAGDEMLSINNTALKKPEDYTLMMQKHWPGDTVTVNMTRNGNAYTKQIVLVERPPVSVSNHPAEMFRGGKSARRDGFNKIFTHDAILTPSQCGGPVFDTDGKFIGINIARFSRTSTLALPASVIYSFISQSINAL